DCVVIFGEETPLELIEALRPDVLVKGGDYTRATIVGADLVEQLGGRVETIELVQGYSSSDLVERIRGAG
ncbi:MAG: D-glycero-beta-D-manno-heptose 1-phosphate adenylyltransferase, partial [Gemmatimonadales bacterium]